MPSAPKGPTPKAPEVKVGDLILDRYRVVEQIGTGGHSVVFKGQDERLSRPVCIKIFSGLGGDSGVGRTSYEHFVQEAFALSRLTHPNTLRIYDFGHLGSKEAAGMPLQVCEYMNGGTLSNIIREQGKQSLSETVRVIGAMCSALSEAHQLGIVHRDIKPQNILFGSVGGNRLPKLADFGIAKWQDEGEQNKQQRAEDTAIVAGQKLAMYSPSWAAPEQLAGQPVSPSTDIYSLACVAIYMMTGKAIFADEDVYAGYKKRRHADELVRETLSPLKVPRSATDVLVRALAFDPKKRLAKVDELSNELQTALEPMTEESPRATPKKGFTAQFGAEPAPAPPMAKYTPPKMQAQEAKPQTGVTEPLAPAYPSGAPNAASHADEPEAMPPPPNTPVFPAPGPAPAPAADLTPATYYAKPGVQAWMQVTPQLTHTQARRIGLMDVPQPVADRRVSFAFIVDRIDLTGLNGTKVRITLMPGPTGNRMVHVKGLTCFVSILGGRPSPALQIDRTSDIAFVTPRAQEIGHLRVAQGTSDGAGNTFQIGTEVVSVGTEDCADPILFDFGPGSDAYFVYTRGRTLPKSGRRG